MSGEIKPISKMLTAAVEPPVEPPVEPTPELEIPVKKKKKETTEFFKEMRNDADLFKSRIQINTNEILHFLAMNDSDIVYSSAFYGAEKGQLRERKEASNRYDILALLVDGKSNGWLNEDGNPQVKAFIKLLKKYDAEFEKIFQTVSQSDKLPFYLLPYYIRENTYLAVTKDEDVWVGMKVNEAKMKSSWFGVSFELKGRVILHNGKDFKEAAISYSVPAYDGEKSFLELGIKIPTQDKAAFAQLVERGKKYEKIHSGGPQYMMHNGPVVRRSWWFNHEFPATGRVMVDRVGMVNIDPNYDKYFGSSRYHDENEDQEASRVFTDDDYFIMSPYAYGFSFVAKQWGEINIDNLTEIHFRSDSYDHLVLNTETKDILFSLTDTSEHGKDLIDGKGGGCIFLLHGTPGVGKTLTAETIAETLKRPLYMVSVGELGTDVSSLEENLRNILQVSASWNAVLLIDEVDIFLEKRDLDIHRNALVGVFLRLLEYYNGILFLTTNRVEQIDPAFYSRISLAIKYPSLSTDARAQIWRGQMKLYGIELPEKNIHQLANDYELNGRQIKNCVRIVNSLSSYKKVTPVLEDFLRVVNKVEEFNKILDN